MRESIRKRGIKIIKTKVELKETATLHALRHKEQTQLVTGFLKKSKETQELGDGIILSNMLLLTPYDFLRPQHDTSKPKRQ